ncbi:phosphatidate cytidylyltransferase [Clostridium acetireducens DSM 10703]|jgi:phosphatidate cytidylyltransferase|uniref:Phosphatidate cytidylyltransferase n=1 Tax=Clostridium acetireducens DSM 10703 TaxID=1121290 RepID=A0A1E8F2F2_9CLOT|nr:phosphatidate cytidylyltransferase [Clostridium acetireducens]OFI07721.1 phosphatidate cytidylyltransferase [Clostridium acetireducens DSM 10703]
MDKRYIGALILSPLIIFLFLGGVYLKYLMFAVSLIGMFEFYNAANKKGINSFNLIGYLLCIVYYITLQKEINYFLIFHLMVFLIIIMLSIPIINLKYNFIDASITIIGFLYIPICFSFIVLTNFKDYGNYLIWLIFISSWLCDTAAYYTGKFFGKNKLCPKVSPKKTIEGSIGGFIGSIIGCGLFGVFCIHNGVNIPIYNYYIIGAICGIVCQFGDLVASSIKRYVGIKDYSNLIPGHGGILDRFDSILFSAVAVYYYISFIIKI